MVTPEAASFPHWFYRKRLPIIRNEGYGHLNGCNRQKVMVCACKNLLDILEQDKEAASSFYSTRQPVKRFCRLSRISGG